MPQVRRASFLFLPRARAREYAVSAQGRARSARGRVFWPLNTVVRAPRDRDQLFHGIVITHSTPS
jgi:hypothetical protein